MAGGLKPGNVKQAILIAAPTIVDVSSGVCGPDGELLCRDLVSSILPIVDATESENGSPN